MIASKQRSRSYAISTHGRWRGARNGKIRTIKAKKNRYADIEIKKSRKSRKSRNRNQFYYHSLQGAAFPEMCGRLTADRNTWDHKHNDRDDPTKQRPVRGPVARRAGVRGRAVGASGTAGRPSVPRHTRASRWDGGGVVRGGPERVQMRRQCLRIERRGLRSLFCQPNTSR